MLKHFNNLRTSLNVIHRYPTTAFQQQRFLDLGWQCARGRTLWDLWSDNRFLNAWQRASLNSIEPFDEWEEFALFASHYFLLVATVSVSPEIQPVNLEWYLQAGQQISFGDVRSSTNSIKLDNSCADVELSFFQSDKIRVTRRFGVLAQRTDRTLELHGGFGSQTRATKSQIFTSNDNAHMPKENPMKSRVCHTITRLDFSPHLNFMVGGRASPNEAFADCWSQTNHGVWYEEPALPKPLYRHSAVSVRLGSASEYVGAILVYGGRSIGGKVMNDWYLCQFPIAEDGTRAAAHWSHLPCEGGTLMPRFGSSLMTTGDSEGVLLGGMNEDGTVLSEMHQWSLETIGEGFTIRLKNQSHRLTDLGCLACRIGATATLVDERRWIVIGGISSNGILPTEQEILTVDFRGSSITRQSAGLDLQIQPISLTIPSTSSRPLFIGHHAIQTIEGIAIAGGGANCFSFGTCWNSGLFFLSHDQKEVHKWHEVEEKPPENESRAREAELQLILPPENVTALPIHTVKVSAQFNFLDIIRTAKPFIIEGLVLGSCSSKWTLPYLKEAINSDRKVRTIIHTAVHDTATFHAIDNPLESVFLCPFNTLLPFVFSSFHLPQRSEHLYNNIHTALLKKWIAF